MSSKSVFGLVFGAVTSRLATKVFNAAMAIHILSLTGDAVSLGISFFMSTLPFLLLSVFTGVVCDHYNRKNIILFCDSIRVLVAVLFLFISYQVNVVPIYMIYTVVFFFSLCEAFVATSFSTIIVDVVKQKELVDVNNLMNGVLEIFNITGPMLGIVIYTAFGFELTTFFVIFLFSISIFTEKNILYTKKSMDHKFSGISNYVREELKIFYGLVKDDVRLTSLFANGFTTHLFLFPFMLIGLPYVITQSFKGAPAEFGILEGVCSAGGLLAVFVVPITKSLGVSKSLFISMIGMVIGAAIFGLILIHPVSQLMLDNIYYRISILSLSCFVVFLFFGVYGVYFVSFLHENISSEKLGKGMSLVMMFNAFGRILGFLLFGFLFEYSLDLAVLVFILGMSAKLLVHVPFLVVDKQIKEKVLSARCEP